MEKAAENKPYCVRISLCTVTLGLLLSNYLNVQLQQKAPILNVQDKVQTDTSKSYKNPPKKPGHTAGYIL